MPSPIVPPDPTDVTSVWGESPVESLLERPPSMLAHGLFYLLIAMMIAAVAFSQVRLDQRVTATGVLIPRGEPRTVKAPSGGLVHQMLVKVGDHVKAGQELLSLDRLEASARREKVYSDLELAKTEQRQALKVENALRSILGAGPAAATQQALEHVDLGPAAGVVADRMRAQNAWDEAEANWQDIQRARSEGKSSSTTAPVAVDVYPVSEPVDLDQDSPARVTHEFRIRLQALRKESERTRHAEKASAAELSTLEKTARYVEEEGRAYESLLADGALAKLEVVAKRRERVAMQGTIQKSRETLRQAAIQREAAELSLTQLTDEARRKRAIASQNLSNLNRLLKQALEAQIIQTRTRTAKVAQLEQDLRLATKASERLSVVSPVNGLVQHTQVLGAGEVVNAGEALIVLFPDGVPFQVDLRIPSRDVGQIRTAMEARVTFEAFPIGYCLDRTMGTVSYVGADPALRSDPNAPFRVLIDTAAVEVRTRDGVFPLKSGMAASADIVVQPRRILDILLKPFRELGQSSGIGG
jgi:hemolysin D